MRKNFIFSLGASLLLPLAASAAIPAGMSEIVLEVGDLSGSGFTGVQWILDSGHSTCNDLFWPNAYMYFGDYSAFDYKMPENADAENATTNLVASGTEMSMTVPAGTYDWMLVCPNADGLLLLHGDYATVDDFTFKEGASYRIVAEKVEGEWATEIHGRMLVACDLQLLQVELPSAAASLSASEPVKAVIRNLGTDDVAGFNVTYTVNGGASVTETYSGTVKPGETVEYTFAKGVDMSATGDYDVHVTVDALPAGSDLIDANNSASATTRCLEPMSLPVDIDLAGKTEEDFAREWVVIDANADGSTWSYNTYLFNRDGNLGAAACYGAAYGVERNDDWLVSMPIEFKAGRHHMVFSVKGNMNNTPETFEVCLGTKAAPAAMTAVETFTVDDDNWYQRFVNFDIPADGIYHLAFRDTSAEGLSLAIGSMEVGTGATSGKSEVRFGGFLVPFSNCDLPAASRLGVTFTNIGTKAIADYTLTCYVNDTEYTTTFAGPVEPGATVESYLDSTVDLSATGVYELQFVLDTDEESLTWSTTVECFAPITEKPVYTNFSRYENMEVWSAMGEKAWNYESMFQMFNSEIPGKHNGLLSRGISFTNPVRIRMQYASSGWGTATMKLYLGRAGEDPMEYGEIFADSELMGEPKEIEFVADPGASGNYSIIIADESEEGSNCHIVLNEIEITEVYPHDIRINRVYAPVSPYTPAAQLGAEGTFRVEVENRGSEEMKGVKVAAFADGEKCGESAQTVDVAAGESAIVSLVAEIPQKEAGEKLAMSFKAEGESADSFEADNELALPEVNVTESMRATENITERTYGVGADGARLAIGNLYTLAVPSDLTSVTVGLSDAEENSMSSLGEIAVNIFKVNPDFSIDRCIYTHRAVRGTGGMMEIDFPDMHLLPGDYYFEVEQCSQYNMGLNYDPDAEVMSWVREDDRLSAVNGYALCVRANFGKDAAVYATDAAVTEFTAPVYTSMLYGKETPVSAIARNSGYEDARFKVELLLDGAKVGEADVDLLSYSQKELIFPPVDLSEPGAHTLECRAILAGDENHANDSAVMQIDSQKEADPYVLDFENCHDFMAKDDLWNPRWRTFDRVGVETTGFWAYDHPHRGEPAGFLAFNPDATTPSMTEAGFKGMYPHSGERFGLVYTFMLYAPGTENLEHSDAWLMSPQLQLGKQSKFELYVKTRDLETPGAELEPYRILISATDDNFDSFVTLGDDVRHAAVEDWEKVEVDLSAYDDKKVYVAVQYIGRTVKNVCLMVDDLKVITSRPDAVESVEADAAVYVDGHDIVAPEGSRVYTAGGIECGMRNLPAGIYIVRTPAGAVKVMVK